MFNIVLGYVGAETKQLSFKNVTLQLIDKSKLVKI